MKEPNTYPPTLALWLVGSHLLAAAIAVAVLRLVPWGAAPVLLAAPAAVLLGGLAGWLATARLRRAAATTGLVLERLSRGQPVAPEALDGRGRWAPLAALMAPLAVLAGRERDLSRLREEMVQSVGQAAAQAERNRLARELHDSIKQQLYAIQVSAAAALVRWETDLSGARAAVEDVRRAAQAAMAEMAALLQQLRPAPLAAAGLLDALREQCEALAHRTGAQVTVDLGQPADAAAYRDVVDEGRLAPGAEEAIYRIGQEALNNIARHARPTHVTVRLRAQGEVLRLEIADDGQGFALPTGDSEAYGLAGMRDRAAAMGAALTVDSAPGKGTRVSLVVPLGQPAAEEKMAMNAEVKMWTQKATTWHWLTLGAALLALTTVERAVLSWTAARFSGLALLGFALPLILVAVTTIAWQRARQAMLRVKVTLGDEHPALWQLRRDAHSRLMWSLLAAVLILPAGWVPQRLPQLPLVGLAVGACCAAFAAAQILLGYRATEGYWRRLPATARTAELAQAWGQRYTPLLVLAVTVPAYFWLTFGGTRSTLAFPPSRELMIDILATVYLGLLIVWAAVGYFQLRRWRERAGVAA